jgi:4-hydroxy-tetrahydrodipicolinate synthase
MSSGHKPADFLQGVIAPMYTPVHEDFSLDLSGTASITEHLVAQHCVTTLFARSGMGKMFTFTVDETKRFADAVMRAAGGKAFLVVGCGGEWHEHEKDRTQKPKPDLYLEQAIELTRFVKALGANGAVHVVPEAFTPSSGESVHDAIYRYYRTVHEAVDVPIVLYQPGGLAKEYELTADLMKRLNELPRIAGGKISTDKDAIFSPLASAVAGTPFALIAGNENYYERGLEQGAVGVIGEGCNAYPQILSFQGTHFRSGHVQDAEQAQKDVWELQELKRHLNGSILWKQVMIKNGVAMKPFDRNGAHAYPPDVVAQIDAAVKAKIAKYPV